MKLLNLPSNLSKEKEKPSGLGSPVPYTTPRPDYLLEPSLLGQALRSHLALKFPTRAPGQLVCCGDLRCVPPTAGDKQRSDKSCK